MGGKGYNVALESLRGLAALMVVVAHLTPFGFGTLPVTATHVGVLGVNVFFTLSGFLIARCVIAPQRFDAGAYLRSRSLRILPNYFMCLIVALLLVDARPILHDSPLGSLGNLISHITLTHGWFEQYHFSIVPPFWTLSHEWWFYLFMMAAAGWLRSAQWVWIVGGMIAVAFLARLGQVERWWEWKLQAKHPLCVLDQFAFGILAAVLTERHRTFFARHRVLVNSLAVTGLVIVVLGCAAYWRLVERADAGELSAARLGGRVDERFFRSRGLMLWFSPGLAVGLAMVLAALWVRPRELGDWLRFTPLPWMGRVSYSTYLWHAPIVFCIAYALRQAPPESPWTDRWFAWWAAVALIYGFSAVGFRLFEQPWLRRQSSQASVSAAP
jgi:peptidoglycan/LPS O-acetylase OafA/YrhL